MRNGGVLTHNFSVYTLLDQMMIKICGPARGCLRQTATVRPGKIAAGFEQQQARSWTIRRNAESASTQDAQIKLARLYVAIVQKLAGWSVSEKSFQTDDSAGSAPSPAALGPPDVIRPCTHPWISIQSKAHFLFEDSSGPGSGEGARDRHRSAPNSVRRGFSSKQ